MHVAGQTFDLPAGHLMALDRAILHDVQALEDSPFLLIISAGLNESRCPEHGCG
jgi:hypothetical protein